MKDRKPARIRKHRVQQAKGAARETIGKLIGDDAEVHLGRNEQETAAAAANTIKKQEE